MKTANRSRSEQVDEQKMIGKNVGFYASEAYKRLRANLSFCVAKNGECRVIGITSSLRGEGKSTTAINLAYTLAVDGKNVLLIDGDMRLPTVAERLQLSAAPGLSNLLSGKNSDAVLQRSGIAPSLYVLTSGELPPNPSELLGSPRMAASVDRLKESMDFIVIDLPPVTEVADALVVSPLLDGVVVVVRRNFATRKALGEAMRQLVQSEVNVLGFVMTHDLGFSAKFGKYGRYKKYRRYGYYKQPKNSRN